MCEKKSHLAEKWWTTKKKKLLARRRVDSSAYFEDTLINVGDIENERGKTRSYLAFAEILNSPCHRPG